MSKWGDTKTVRRRTLTVSDSTRYVPDSHAVQDVLLAPLNWPGGQLEHAAEAMPVAAFTSVLPTPHEMHDEDPAPEYCPEPQLSQEDDSSEDENLPAAHSLQVVLPDSLNLPAMQTSHASDSTPVSALTSCLP